MRELLLLLLAAALEVGGDASIRFGLKSGRAWGFALGALALFAYGIFVNLPKWDFGRLMGVYIATFFVVAQLVSTVIFKEKLQLPVIVGGSFIVVGGIIMTVWRMQSN